MKRFVVWFVVLIVVLSLGACKPTPPAETAGGGAQTQATQPSATPVPAKPTKAPEAKATPVPTTAKATQTPKAEATQPPAEDEDLGQVVDPQESDKITSYRQKLVVEATEEGQSQFQWDSLVEWDKATPARRTLVTGTSEDGEPFEWESIEIGDTTYMRVGDEWMAVSTAEEPPVESEFYTWTEPGTWENSSGCSYKGTETVNGLRAKHWHCTEKVFVGAQPLEGGQIEKGSIDSWISPDYEIAIKTVVEWEGKDEEGKDYSFHMTAEVYDINQPIDIQAPEGVEMPGLPDDIPMIAGAQNVSAIGQMVTFEVEQPLDDVAAFYTQAMADNGWQKGEAMPVPGMMQFTRATGARSS